MQRRRFLRGLGSLGAAAMSIGALGTACGPSMESKTTRMFKIVFLFTRLTEPVVQSNMSITRQGLRDLGYVEGQNIAYDERDAEGDTTRFRALAPEVVGLSPDVIICQNVQAALELKAATTTIPIVFVAINADPLEAEVVSNLGRPGGNITGIGIAGSALAAKRLQLLKDAVPTVTRVAVIQDAGLPGHALAEMQAAAPALGMEIVPVLIRTANDLDAALAAAVDARANALVQTAGFVTGTQTSARKVADFAIRQGWPTVGVAADLGGFLNYGGVLVDPWRRAATFVDRILRGTDPGDIPVEGPTGATFVINMCTAARLGLTIPRSVLTLTTSLVQCPPS